MRKKISKRAISALSAFAICAAILSLSACSSGAPDVPSDHVGRWENDTNSLCQECHFTSEDGAPIPPNNHFKDGDSSTETFDSGYSKCYECHDGLF